MQIEATRPNARAISTGHGLRSHNQKNRMMQEQAKLNSNNSSTLVLGPRQIINHIQTIVRNRNPTQAATNPYFNQEGVPTYNRKRVELHNNISGGDVTRFGMSSNSAT